MNSTLELSAFRRTKRRVFHILEGDVADPASRFCEIFIATLVILNVLAIILESVPEIHEAWGRYLHVFDLFSVGVFTVEYVLRVWSYSEKYTEPGDSPWKGRKEYIFSFYGLVDFFSTVPFYLQLLMPGTDLRVLRMFRLLRIFKLSRYNSAMDDMFEAIKAEKETPAKVEEKTVPPKKMQSTPVKIQPKEKQVKQPVPKNLPKKSASFWKERLPG